MQNSRHQTFASACLPANHQSTERNLSQTFQQISYVLRGFAVSDKSLRRIALVSLLGMFKQAALGIGAASRAIDDHIQPFQVAGFFQEIISTQTQSPHRVGDAAIASEEYPFCIGLLRADFLHQIECIAVGQVHVG